MADGVSSGRKDGQFVETPGSSDGVGAVRQRGHQDFSAGRSRRYRHLLPDRLSWLQDSDPVGGRRTETFTIKSNKVLPLLSDSMNTKSNLPVEMIHKSFI